MVAILHKNNYDGKYGPYARPNFRKAKIMAKVAKTLHLTFGVRCSKDQIRKRWSDLKLREPDQYRRIRKVLKKREKRLRQDEPSPVTPDCNTRIGNSAQAPQRMLRKERWATWPPHQVIWLCKNQAPAPPPRMFTKYATWAPHQVIWLCKNQAPAPPPKMFTKYATWAPHHGWLNLLA